MEVDFRFGQFPACSRKVAWIKDLAQKTGDSKGDSRGFWISDPYLFGSGGRPIGGILKLVKKPVKLDRLWVTED
jgi:hypothetical protein